MWILFAFIIIVVVVGVSISRFSKSRILFYGYVHGMADYRTSNWMGVEEPNQFIYLIRKKMMRLVWYDIFKIQHLIIQLVFVLVLKEQMRERWPYYIIYFLVPYVPEEYGYRYNKRKCIRNSKDHVCLKTRPWGMNDHYCWYR